MSNSITGRCWLVDESASTLTAEPTRIMAIQLNPHEEDDSITLTDTAGVRIAKVEQASHEYGFASVYQVFPKPGVFGRGVKCSALSNGASAIIYLY